MAAGDLIFKSTVSILGLTTVVAGLWLGASMFKGFQDVSQNRRVRHCWPG